MFEYECACVCVCECLTVTPIRGEACHKSCVQWSFKLATLSKINFVNCSHTHTQNHPLRLSVFVELTAIDKADVTSCGLDKLTEQSNRDG